MTRKERIDLLLSKIPEDKRDAFVAKLREAKDQKERAQLLKECGITFTEEEKAAFKAGDGAGNEISDAELDQAAGGCSCKCACPGNCMSYCF